MIAWDSWEDVWHLPDAERGNESKTIGEINMAFSLAIPNEVVWAIKLPKKQMENQLIKEFAFSLYDRELTSMGVARRFAKMSKWAFIEGLAERGITRHYYANEVEEDINYARSCQ